MRLLRHTNELVGLLVVLSVVLFIAAVLHAGVLGDWFRPTTKLRVLLPEAGSQGLGAGSDIEVLGTRIGAVRRIVVDPSQRLYAEAELDEQATGFIRRDSQAVVKKRFGVAGAAFLEISRGTGAPLNWSFAVIEAKSERDPAENISVMIDEVKSRVVPILDDTARAMHALADTAEAISQGRGNVGRLLRDKAIVEQVGHLLDTLNALSGQARDVIAELQSAAASLTGNQGVPPMLRRINDLLASLQSMSRDLAATAQRLPAISRNVAESTPNLPALITQAQQSLAELEKLLNQTRRTWPFSGAAAPESRRLSPAEVKP
jgi:phospholipid/cholesterol/gamma-HCH transport system substrate-binding protein